MQFNFSRENLPAGEKKAQRLLEILPGISSWTILLGMTILSIVRPLPAAIFIIAFELYWFLRLLYMTIFLIISFVRLRIEEKTDWMERIRGIDDAKTYSKILEKMRVNNFFKYLSLRSHRKAVARLIQSEKLPPGSESIYHLVIYPIARESREIIEPGIESLNNQVFPLKRILVVFALEERAPEKIKNAARALEEKYKNNFFACFTVLHPTDLPGEARVKGANVTCAAKEAARYLRSRDIPFENVVISCFDADTIVGPEYFACLTYHFMVTPHRDRSSFQPIPVYHNNIWQVPGFARVIETGSSFFQLMEATNPEKLVTFSSHSMSFKALVEVNYWPVDMISDDSAIFWKAYIHHDGKYRVVPMYVTLSMDVASADTWWQTIQSVYKQKRRWAWGVENFPIVTRAFLKADKISFYDKMRHGFKLFEGHVAWATWSFLLTVIGWLPLIFAQQEFSQSVVYYNAPRITAVIFNLASLSVIASIFLSIAFLPKRKSRYPLLRKIGQALEWLLVPITMVFLSALPALDAQTRMMIGKRMEFVVTEKKRKN